MIKLVLVAAAMFALSVLCGTADGRGPQAGKRFSREELLVSTKPMGQTFMKVLAAQPRESAPPTSTALRIERMFIHVLQEAKRLRPSAEDWDWELVLVADDAHAPFALPDGQIFVSPKWVANRRLTDGEIALLLGHEMAHVIADHMLERVSAFAAARPHNMRVADVLRTLQEEWYLARELEPLERKASLAQWTRAQNLVCLD